MANPNGNHQVGLQLDLSQDHLAPAQACVVLENRQQQQQQKETEGASSSLTNADAGDLEVAIHQRKLLISGAESASSAAESRPNSRNADDLKINEKNPQEISTKPVRIELADCLACRYGINFPLIEFPPWDNCHQLLC